MIFPISGSISEMSFPLIGHGLQISFGFPEWIDNSPNTVFHNTLSILGKEFDKTSILINRTYEGTVPGDGYNYEPRSGHISIYIPGPYSVSGVVINQASTYEDFILDYSPICYVSTDGYILYRNLNTILSIVPSSTGTVDDRLYYYNKINVPSPFFNGYSSLDFNNSGIYLSPSTESDVDITYSSGTIRATLISLRNHWDNQALYLGLSRDRQENNISLRTRIQSSLLNRFNKDTRQTIYLSKSRSEIVKDISTELGTVEVITTTQSFTTSGNVYSPLTSRQWDKEFLYPVNNTGSISKKIISYFRSNSKELLSCSGGVFEIKTPQEIQYLYTNWSVSGNTVSISKDITQEISFVISKFITVQSLHLLKNKLISNKSLTDLGKNVYSLLLKKQSTYGNRQWRDFSTIAESSITEKAVFFQD